ncbi:MAG: flagellar basal body protein [Tepidisphaeraceae bacterium]
MIYGLWFSATGIVTNSHQTDVIANNLANAETAGFKRELVTFAKRAPKSSRAPVSGGRPTRASIASAAGNCSPPAPST